MKIYVIEMYNGERWELANRCFATKEAAANMESAIAADYTTTYVHSIDLVDELQAYVEQRNQDNVNHPAHYTNGEIECIDAIRAALTPEEFRGYVKGLTIKYVWREQLKGHDEDLAKARWYLDELLGGIE